MPGVGQDYTASTTANVISTAGDALLSVADPSSTTPASSSTARSPCRAAAGDGDRRRVRRRGRQRHPDVPETYTAPISNDSVTLTFKQAINANDALRTGTYSKTLTFTLSTTTP